MEQSNKLPENERKRLNEISRDVIGAAIRVHSILGPGLLENAYEACLEHEIRRRGHRVLRQVALPVVFEAGGRLRLQNRSHRGRLGPVGTKSLRISRSRSPFAAHVVP